jgi:AcrR family transcriptional regulator
MLATELGISGSSLYSAFGTKSDLFEEAIRTYALRYSAVYDRALAEPSLAGVIRRLLVDSVLEFTRADDGHPGCLPTSAVMADSSPTLDVRTYVADLQRADETRLRMRIDRAQQDGELPASVAPTDLTNLVLTIWQGLSTRAELGTSRDDLLAATELALDLPPRTDGASSRSPVGLAGTAAHPCA